MKSLLSILFCLPLLCQADFNSFRENASEQALGRPRLVSQPPAELADENQNRALMVFSNLAWGS